jgi:hypothetical protein
MFCATWRGRTLDHSRFREPPGAELAINCDRMNGFKCLLTAAALGSACAAAGVPEAAVAGPHRHAHRDTSPVVVELFTAQGCAPCKQANRMIAHMAERRGVIVLMWSVDYWDYLGWKDTFAQPAFTARQKAYAKHLGPQDVYTPQVVINGAAQVSGDDAAAVEAAVQSAAGGHTRPGPKLRIMSGGRVSVGRGLARGPAEVWLVRFDPREQDVAVTAGDNRGATVAHRNVVRELARLGPWKGRAETFTTPLAAGDGLISAVIVQGAHGGPVIAATQSKPAS